jgi:hypothetical protein
VGCGEPHCLLTRAWEAVRLSVDGDEGGRGLNSSPGRALAQRVGNGDEDECGEEGGEPLTFYNARVEWRRPSGEGIGRRRW